MGRRLRGFDHNNAAKKAIRHKKPKAMDGGPLHSIDWAPRRLSSNPILRSFDNLAGPGSTAAEICVTATALAFGLAYVWNARDPSWTTAQLCAALVLCTIDCPAAVQTTLPTAKRHYHAGGELSLSLFLVMELEAVGQVLFAGWAFRPAGLVLADCTLAAALGAAMLLVFASPLSVQRGASVLGFLGFIAVLGEIGPPSSALAWFPVVAAVKYIISHTPRAEPYVDNAESSSRYAYA